jgi:hypothetical protein
MRTNISDTVRCSRYFPFRVILSVSSHANMTWQLTSKYHCPGNSISPRAALERTNCQDERKKQICHDCAALTLDPIVGPCVGTGLSFGPVNEILLSQRRQVLCHSGHQSRHLNAQTHFLKLFKVRPHVRLICIISSRSLGMQRKYMVPSYGDIHQLHYITKTS